MDPLVFPYRCGHARPMAEREWLKLRELAAREGIMRNPSWRWAAKDWSRSRRLDTRTGVRARLRTAAELAALTTPAPSSRRPPPR